MLEYFWWDSELKERCTVLIKYKVYNTHILDHQYIIYIYKYMTDWLTDDDIDLVIYNIITRARITAFT